MRSRSAIALVVALCVASGARAQDAGTLPEAGTLPDAGTPPEVGPDAGMTIGEDDEPVEDDALPEHLRPEVTYRLEPESGVMTGDLVHVILTVRLRNEGDDVAIPRQDLGDLELFDQRHTDRVIDDRREFTFELDFLALEPGEHEIAPITLRVVTAEGVIGTVRTEAHTVTVGALTANEPDAQPRPATDPVVVMEDDYTLAYVLGFFAAMLLSALVGWLLARWWRRRPKVEPPPPPPRPPAEIALEKLKALRKRMREAVAEGKEGEIVDGASDALREYLGARYDFNGLESTTDEVIARVRHARLGPISLNEIIALLSDADLVKFAKAPPDEAQCERMLEGAERIVRGTVPVATAVATPAAARIDQTPARPKKRAVPSTAKHSQVDAPTADIAPTDPGRVVPVATSTEGFTRNERGEKIDHLGRRIPDTNPPPPPTADASTTIREERKPIETIRGTADGPTSAPDVTADETTGRATPVGFTDPALPTTTPPAAPPSTTLPDGPADGPADGPPAEPTGDEEKKP